MLVIPAVSMGNVPQLAIDLLIYTYDFELVCSLDDQFLHAFVGPLDSANESPTQAGTHARARPGVPNGITTTAQLYKANGVYLVQLRSPPLANCSRRFLQSLKQEISRIEPEILSHVLLVGSANAGRRLNGLGEKEIVSFDSSTKPEFLPDSGYLLSALCVFEHSSAIVEYAYEGDNLKDAEVLACHVSEYLKLPRKNLSQPVSWRRLYGRDIPTGLEQGLYA